MSEDSARLLNAAEGFCQLGMWEDAWNELEELLPENRAAVPVILMRMEILTALEKFESAAVLAESLIAKGVREKRAFLLGAQAIRICRSPAEGAKFLLSGEDLLADDARFHYDLACYASVAGRIDDSTKHLARAFELDPDLRMRALDDPDLAPFW